jgi:predicted O-methyltransferase YrrM
MTLEDYILRHTDAEPEYLTEIERNSYLKMINPRMCSGHLQGRILSMMCQMIQPVFALEIGTFTGYSALCIAESIPENGQLDTIEKDDELEDLIRHNFQKSPYKDKINLIIGDAIEIIPELNKEYDLVFMDGDKREYSEYFNLVFPKVRKGGFIFADNTLWNGKVIEQTARNDKQTLEILHFNDALIDDDRIEKVILPIRDGLTIIRKK